MRWGQLRDASWIAVNQHPRANLLYLTPVTLFCSSSITWSTLICTTTRIKAFHVKDAEFRPNGQAGRLWRIPGLGKTGLADSARWATGRLTSGAIFSKLTQYGYRGWAVLEWECCLKDPEDGAREGAPFISKHIINMATKSFDDFAGASVDKKQIQHMLGL